MKTSTVRSFHVDGQGNDLPSNFYDVTVNAANPGGGGGTTTPGHMRIWKEKGGFGKNWVVAYDPIYGNPGLGNPQANYLAEMISAAAETVHSSQYGIQNDAVVNQENLTWGYPLEFLLENSSDWVHLKNLIAFEQAENFVYFGHGGKAVIGRQPGLEITSVDIDNLLHNLHDPLAGVGQGRPYRFVFLDGCNTAKGNLPEAFGIPKKEIPESDFRDKYKVLPRAFLGWSSLSMTGPRSVLDGTRKDKTVEFWAAWSGLEPDGNPTGQPAVGVKQASQLIHSAGFWNNKITFYGCPTLSFY